MSGPSMTKGHLAALDAKLASHGQGDDIPGLVALVSRREETHVCVCGRLAAGVASPMRRDSLFRISSMTKPVTAAATMLLVEDGALRLEDAVDRWLPELADRRVLRRLDGPVDDTVPAKRPITVEDLLTFRMGFGILMMEPGVYPIQKAADELRLGQGPPSPSVPPAPDEWMRRLGSLPLMSQPGEQWIYSGGADVLGVLIARVSGRPFGTFLRERLFEPLGMRDTGFAVPESQIGRFTTEYASDPVTGGLVVRDPAEGGEWSRPPEFPSGAAGLVSTVDDYHAFAKMLLGGGSHAGKPLLSRRSVEAMTTDHLTEAQRSDPVLPPGFFGASGWGYGVSVVIRADDPTEPVGSYGWSGGLGTLWSNNPRAESVTILLTQRMSDTPTPSPVVRDFVTLAHRAIVG
ncbi:MAG: beta-lactamase family protein [Thermoplasmata archaeon]|nr:beta-lactamase family protein [Thermoplasmata archaeon]